MVEEPEPEQPPEDISPDQAEEPSTTEPQGSSEAETADAEPKKERKPLPSAKEVLKHPVMEGVYTVLMGLLLAAVLFWPVALITDQFFLALGLAPFLAAGALYGLMGVLPFVGRTRERLAASKPWVRGLLLTVLAVFFIAILTVLLSPIDLPFPVYLGIVVLGGTAASVAVGHFTGLSTGIRSAVQGSSPRVVVVMGSLLGIVVTALVFSGLLLVLPFLAVVALSPFLLVGLTTGLLMVLGWREGYVTTLQGAPIWSHLLIALAALAAGVFYGMLTLGPLVPIDALGFVAAAVVGVTVAILVLGALGTRQRMVKGFIEAGERNRVLVLLPALILSALIVGLAVAFTTGSLELGVLASLPGAILGFLLIAKVFGALEDIPRVVKGLKLWPRSGVFLLTWVALALYFILAIGLYIDSVQLAILGGLLIGGLAVLGLVKALHLDEGMRDEFESMGGAGEAGVVVLLFLAFSALASIVLLSVLPEAGPAVLLGLLIGALATTLVARALGLREKVRGAVGRIPWPAAWVAMLLLFIFLTTYLVLGMGMVVNESGVAIPLGALLALPLTYLVGRELGLYRIVADSVRDEPAARITLVITAFIGALLLGTFGTAGPIQLTGLDLLVLPYLIGVALAVGAAVLLARRFQWFGPVQRGLLGRPAWVKLLFVLVVWVGLSYVASLFASSFVPETVPLVGDIAVLFPLTMMLLVPVALSVAKALDAPITVALGLAEAPRLGVALFLGLVAAAVTLVFALAIYPNTATIVASLVVGYIVALAVAGSKRRDPARDKEKRDRKARRSTRS